MIIVLVVSAFLRLWSLGSGDTISDEALYSFRAIGMLDFDEAAEQTTPLEWFDPFIPSWTSYSFHDHPPLVFFTQHIFMRIFGETPFAFRLPSALFGIASVYLLYLIGSYLYGKRAGLLASALMGTTINHVAISRIGLQESHVIFFILLAVYVFLKAEKQKKYYILVGVTTGLALLVKYTTGILFPIFLTYMILFRRKDFSSRFVSVGAALALLVFSPVLYYNYKLYQTVGHFDFQFSYLVGQNPEVWSIQPGKEEFPTLSSRMNAFLPNIIAFNSWLFLALFAISVIAFLVSVAKQWKETLRRHALLLIIFFWLLALVIGAIGPSLRFLSLLTPFIALGIGFFISNTNISTLYISEVQLPNTRKLDFRNISIYIIIFFLAFELSYSINSQIIPYPKGPELWAWSRVRYENYNWGYQELDSWMREKTDSRMPALAFEPKYHFIGEIHKKALAKAEHDGKKPLASLFVYDKNINSIAQIWILDRLQIYHAWPVVGTDTYTQFLNEKGNDYFERSGFKEIYFIFPSEHVPWKQDASKLTDIGTKLEQALTTSGLKPYTALKNKRSELVFRIYRKELR